MGGATLGLCIAAGALLARFTALDPPRRSRSGQVAASPLVGGAKDWLLTLGIAVGGVTLSSLARMSAGTLLMPMILAAVVVLAVPGGEFVAPQLVAQMAFALIGLQVGLSFTMDTVRLLGRLLVPVLTSIVGLLVACFGLAALLHLTSSVTLLDAYLATTPGGLFAVLAVAFGAGANTTFILAAQGLRILVMVLLAPLVVRRITRDRRTTVAARSM